MLHRNDVADPPEADVALHVEGMSVDEQVDQLRRLWDKTSDEPSVQAGPFHGACRRSDRPEC